jgi:hypothetical protein
MDVLKRDFCWINNPIKLNYEIPDLSHRLENTCLIPCDAPASSHLIDIADEHPELCNQATKFLFAHLLHWMEVISFLREVTSIFIVLRDLEAWFRVC